MQNTNNAPNIHHGDVDVVLDRPKIKTPSHYQVLLLNDDYTPMEFVVHVLQKFFSVSKERATEIMVVVHTKGKGACGTFVRDVAETHAMRINGYAMAHQHPLRCRVEAIK